MKRYRVKIIARNVFNIEAENAEDAEAQVKELGVRFTLEHSIVMELVDSSSDFEIEEVREGVTA